MKYKTPPVERPTTHEDKSAWVAYAMDRDKSLASYDAWTMTKEDLIKTCGGDDPPTVEEPVPEPVPEPVEETDEPAEEPDPVTVETTTKGRRRRG